MCFSSPSNIDLHHIIFQLLCFLFLYWRSVAFTPLPTAHLKFLLPTFTYTSFFFYNSHQVLPLLSPSTPSATVLLLTHTLRFILLLLLLLLPVTYHISSRTNTSLFLLLISLPKRLRRNQHQPLPNMHPLSDYISTRNDKIPILPQTLRSLVRMKCGDFPLFTPLQFSWYPDRNSSSESPVAYFFILPRTAKSALAILPL